MFDTTISEWEWFELFSETLRREMYYSGMTQRELSDISGVSESSISNYLNKKKIPSIKSVVNICQALNISTDSLINFEKRIV